MIKPPLMAGPGLIAKAIEAHERSTPQLEKHARTLGVSGRFMESHARNLMTLKFLKTRKVPNKQRC